jgi:hypothetical protein
MIITRLFGGLGNQLFQYSTGKAVAAYHRTELKFDTSFFKTQSKRTLDLTKLRVSLTEATPQDIIRFRGRFEILRNAIARLTRISLRPSGYIKEGEPTVLDDRLFNAGNDMYLDGYWQNETYFAPIRHELLEELVPASPLSLPAQQELQNFNDEPFISIHVRRGDYVTDPVAARIHGFLGVDYYLRALDVIRDLLQANYRLAVFSDDIPWCEDNLAVPKGTLFVKHTQGGIEDLYLMSRAAHHIIANSSFSWWAAWLNRSPSKVVIAPRKWLASNPDAYNWTPSSWHVI